VKQGEVAENPQGPEVAGAGEEKIEAMVIGSTARRPPNSRTDPRTRKMSRRE